MTENATATGKLIPLSASAEPELSLRFLERKSRFYLVKKVTSKHADAVADATIEMLQPFKALVHSITADNGLEFAVMNIRKELETDVYFADPYASYQRGANENANGLLRQYVPKGTDLRTVTNKLIAKYQQRLNLRPRENSRVYSARHNF